MIPMPEEKLSGVKKLSFGETKVKRAQHITILRSALPRVERLKERVIKKKGKIKPKVER